MVNKFMKIGIGKVQQINNVYSIHRLKNKRRESHYIGTIIYLFVIMKQRILCATLLFFFPFFLLVFVSFLQFKYD